MGGGWVDNLGDKDQIDVDICGSSSIGEIKTKFDLRIITLVVPLTIYT